MSRLLDAEELGRQLADLPGWRLESGHLVADYECPDDGTAVRLAAEVVDEAQVMGHRPDVVRRGGRVGVRTATASASGVTQRDVELAHRVREWAQRLGATPSPAR